VTASEVGESVCVPAADKVLGCRQLCNVQAVLCPWLQPPYVCLTLCLPYLLAAAEQPAVLYQDHCDGCAWAWRMGPGQQLHAQNVHGV
jgi:hypothetical protein